ncbi:hypothetical protein IE53DRAFT_366991 [Violaceomyces palustris]|uniref:Uncharacterized protein n=1 Tax=Violaceomyces palustris TaxID=1673888 RepID=A0ACD0P3P3_9BASI|nr:hypothetical protein IE53DRAFT_366991 [Violaceomyces palustris]
MPTSEDVKEVPHLPSEAPIGPRSVLTPEREKGGKERDFDESKGETSSQGEQDVEDEEESGAVKPLSDWRLNSPRTQNWIAGAILGCGPGIYLAITGLGAGGGNPNSSTFISALNTMGNGLYGVFSFLGCLTMLFLDPRWMLVIGPTGYAVYILSMIYFQKTSDMIFSLILCIYWGLGSSFIWVGSTYVSMVYSTPANKGQFINDQWIGLSLGSVVGASIALGANLHKDKVAGVSVGVLCAWLAIHLSAALAAFFLLKPPSKVIGSNGKPIPIGRKVEGRSPEWKAERLVKAKKLARELILTLTTDPKVYLAALTMFGSDFWLVYIGSWNSYHFTLRARSLNNFCYWLVQIPAALLLSKLLDGSKGLNRRSRGILGFSILSLVTISSWVALWVWQSLRHDGMDRSLPHSTIDWKDKDWVGGFIVYIIFGLSYPTYHVVLVYYFSSLASEGQTSMSVYASIFKGSQALGIALAFGVEVIKPNLMIEGGVYGAYAVLSLIPLGYCFFNFVKPETVLDVYGEDAVGKSQQA